ncbi:hypothetical protein DC3_31860 [Deinococcus cellulosilyticus NBRC 106333 = KACC 11606]|uniref:Uncharacterized protein n=1 Tax=Deinococcus cellulosilyticus (strain DSM 18568 / NBRC 106333 / KACC 11606 / 5516J-15) TaxID=1223518 RepID=A0A511N544_DEIC1|nr:hypothetical protein DC3_31860 [Deinococcus cellulosilyticus NBRC 106333 = KACC 11606]
MWSISFYIIFVMISPRPLQHHLSCQRYSSNMDAIYLIVGAAVAGPLLVVLVTSVMNMLKERAMFKQDLD